MFKEGYSKHNKEMAKLSKWERFCIELIPFIISGVIIYILCL